MNGAIVGGRPVKVTLSDKREPDPKRAPKTKKEKSADNSGSDASDEETHGEQQAESEEEDDDNDDTEGDKSEAAAGGEKKKKPKSQRAKPTDNSGKTIVVSGWPQGSTKDDVKEAFTAEQRHIELIDFPLSDRSIPTAAIIFKGHKASAPWSC